MSLFEQSELTASIIRHLRAFEKGTRLTYAELSTGVGSTIRPNSHHLQYARRVLERDHQQIWVSIRPRVGIHRLDDKEIAERLAGWWLTGARRKLKRGGDQSDTVETNKLDIDEQARFSVNCIQRELAAQSLSKPTWRHLEKVARGSSNDLPSFNILEWAISLMPKQRSP